MPAIVEITADQLYQLAPHAAAEVVAGIVQNQQLLDLFGVSTPLRVAHFFAQTSHETQGFTRLVENLNYGAPGLRSTWPSRFRTDDIARSYHRQPERIANYVYANRMGNGDEASGDGWRFRGRGLGHATGRAMYRAIGYEDRPDEVATMPAALSTALAIWRDEKNCSPIADRDDVRAITLAWNGGLNGLDERERLTDRAKLIWFA